MLKRITLLRRKDNMPERLFRAHWAEPHAEIAKGFEGLGRYNQNRVDRVLWESGDYRFEVDGIVELWFESQEAVDRNATSETTKALVIDEPIFLSGLTALVIGESGLIDIEGKVTKLMILAHAEDPETVKARLTAMIATLSERDRPAEIVIDTMALSFTREALWAEPIAPNLCVSLWVREGVEDMATLAGSEGKIAAFFKAETTSATAYEIDELRIV